MVKLQEYRQKKKKHGLIEVHTGGDILVGKEAYDYLHCRGKWKNRRMPRYLQQESKSKKKGKQKGSELYVPPVRKVKVHEPDFIEEAFWGTGAEVTLSKLAFNKMSNYCNAANTEVSGFAHTKIVKPRDKGGVAKIYIDEVVLPQQKCGSGSTELTDNGLADFMTTLAKRGESTQQWNCWWHTHYNFSTFWSGIDTANIKRLLGAHDCPFVSVVLNQAGSILARVDAFIDGKRYTSEAEISVEKDRDESALAKKCAAEVNDKVTVRRWQWGKGVKHVDAEEETEEPVQSPIGFYGMRGWSA